MIMPILRNVNYDYADRESAKELHKALMSLEMNVDSYIENVNDTQLRGLMRNDLKRLEEIKEIANKNAYENLSREEVSNGFKMITNALQEMHLLDYLQEYNKRTDYEFVRDESYQKLAKVAENIENARVLNEYLRANYKVREVMSKYGEPEKIEDGLRDIDDMVPFEEKQKAMGEELKKAKAEIEYLLSSNYKEDAEKAKKDILYAKDAYAELNDIAAEVAKYMPDITDIKESMEDLETAISETNKQIKEYQDLLESNTNVWEEFRKEWNLDKDTEISIRTKLQAISVFEKDEIRLKENEVEANEEKIQEIINKRSQLNMEIMELVGYNSTMLERFSELEMLTQKITSGLAKVANERNAVQNDYNILKEKYVKDIEPLEKKVSSLEERFSRISQEYFDISDLNAFTQEAKTKIEASIDNREKEWSNERFEERLAVANNKVNQIENDIREIQGYNTFVQENTMQAFANFKEHILDGSKDINQKNSKEFSAMEAALDDILKEKKNLSPEKFAEKVRAVKESAEKYYEAKKAQIRLMPSTQRVMRMEFAKNLAAHCDHVLENQTYTLVTKTGGTRDLEASKDLKREDRDLNLLDRVTELEGITSNLDKFSKDFYHPIAALNSISKYSSAKPSEKEAMVFSRMIASFGADGTEVEKQEFVNRFFNDYGMKKQTNPEDKKIFQNAAKDFAEASKDPEKLKNLMENAIRRMGTCTADNLFMSAEARVAMGVFANRCLDLCEKKNIPISNEMKNLANGVALFGRVTKEIVELEKGLLTHTTDKSKTYEEALKRHTAMKILEGKLNLGTPETIAAMGASINADEALDMFTDLVGSTRGFKDLMACSPKTVEYLIAGNGEEIADLHNRISKEGSEIRNEINRDVENYRKQQEIQQPEINEPELLNNSMMLFN